jgi:hypothetical protein
MNCSEDFINGYLTALEDIHTYVNIITENDDIKRDIISIISDLQSQWFEK